MGLQQNLYCTRFFAQNNETTEPQKDTQRVYPLMIPVIKETDLKNLCTEGTRIDEGIGAPDFARVRQALDDCVELLRKMTAMKHVDSYLAAKTALAFAVGLAVTEQAELLSNLFEFGRLFKDNEKALEAKCRNAASFDGMLMNRTIEPRELKFLAMGMFFCCNPEYVQLEIRDTMIVTQLSLVEKVLRQREAEKNGTASTADAEKLADSFVKLPDMIFDYLQHEEKELLDDLISFWEYCLATAYKQQIPETCAGVFARRVAQQPIVTTHNHFRFLPLLPWKTDKTSYAFDEELKGSRVTTVQTRKSTLPAVAGGWFSELPEVGVPLKTMLGIHFLSCLLAFGVSQTILWSGIAVTLASIFYRVCLVFKDEMKNNTVATATFFLYLFVSFMSIGAFQVEGLLVGMFAAVIMHAVFPAGLGVILVGRKKLLELLYDIFHGGNGPKHLK